MNGPLILVVEDNERNMKLIRDVLDYAGYEVVAVGTAEDGITSAQQRCPDLVLMDLQLPGMGGVEALGRLRDAVTTRAVPVVAVTAFAMKGDRDRVLQAGFNGYLEKPISVRDLPGQVRSFLHPKEEAR
jgi:two-component system cell cycle response regulator DivK